MIYAILILAAVCALLGYLLYRLYGQNKKYSEQVVELEKTADVLRDNLNEFRKYAENLQRIRDSKEEITEKIQEAGSDEEVAGVIADIIRANNERVRDDKK